MTCVAPKPMPVESAPVLALPLGSVSFGEPFGPLKRSMMTNAPVLGLPVAAVLPGFIAGMSISFAIRRHAHRFLARLAGARTDDAFELLRCRHGAIARVRRVSQHAYVERVQRRLIGRNRFGLRDFRCCHFISPLRKKEWGTRRGAPKGVSAWLTE